MQKSKTAYYDIEAFHDDGKLVIQFMPEFLDQVQEKISTSGYAGSPPGEFECLKFTLASNMYLKIIMQKIEFDYSNELVDWFLKQDWQSIKIKNPVNDAQEPPRGSLA
jgi:hypothetical protein